MDIRQCSVCGAKWVDGQLYWATGKPGKDIDLNALVCRRLPSEKAPNCINPCQGQDGGVGWEERMGMVNAALTEFEV